MKRIQIPETLTEFFHWVKATTEKFWGENELEDDKMWLRNAKWQGMQDADIEAIEAKYGFKFLPEHKEFLRILHTIDKYEVYEYEKDGKTVVKTSPFFYNWLKEDEMKKPLEWSFRTIFDDIQKGTWLKSWGKKPDNVEDKKTIFAQWYAKAPSLLPITGHRFIVNDENLLHRPILSVWGSDIIVYGWDFRLYLLNELEEYLDIIEMVDEEEVDINGTSLSIPFPIYTEEVQKIRQQDYELRQYRTIPYWEDMILHYSSGWSSFGKECPFEPKTEDGLRPIVSENSQATKTFTDHSS